jgi:hypothetical protein
MAALLLFHPNLDPESSRMARKGGSWIFLPLVRYVKMFVNCIHIRLLIFLCSY